MTERKAPARPANTAPSPEDVARVAAARFVLGLPEDRERSRKIAEDLAARPVTPTR